MTTAVACPTRSCLTTTEGLSVPLAGVRLQAEVLGGISKVRVTQRYLNVERKAVEAIYVFPLASTNVLTGFSMTCGDRRTAGVLKEREDAFRAYDEAITAGHGGALLEEERRNVFTASVGNLLPGEETLIEIEYLERTALDEGSLRVHFPTLVAPRYVPGTPGGDRTSHGVSDPTDRVPDADRVTPPIGDAPYGLSLDVLFDLGRRVDVECPSHRVTVADEGEGRTRVRFMTPEVALDRDVVLLARPRPAVERSWLTVSGGGGYVAVTLVPDLLDRARRGQPLDVVFVLDTSGSMEGDSIREARAALKLCLRQLHEGDRFDIIGFSSSHTSLSPGLLTFEEATLRKADAFVDSRQAGGGTELLEPLLHAARLVPDGIVVLLTDGQVGNESEILERVLSARASARFLSFGIGTSVSDVLLRDLAAKTDGAVELIHPGERIDEKVVAQFARATAARVTGLTLRFAGLDVHELAPSKAPSLVDGEPFVLAGRYDRHGEGTLTLTGSLRGERFEMSVPIALPDRAAPDAVRQLWASERIRELSRAEVTGRREKAMKDRIVALSLEHGVLSPYTAFVAIEERAGERRGSGQPRTRVVPVNVPAGWAMFGRVAEVRESARKRMGAAPSGAAAAMPAALSMSMPMPARAPMAPPSATAAAHGGGLGKLFKSKKQDTGSFAAVARSQAGPPPPPADPVVALFSRQLASGLWDDGGTASDGIRWLEPTARALVALALDGITTTHPVHGALAKKAVEALLLHLATLGTQAPPDAVRRALGAAHLVATGRRTRGEIEALAEALAASRSDLGDLAGLLADEVRLRAFLGAGRGAAPLP